MPDYRQMYLKLFRSCTQVIDALRDAQLETEEIYIASEDAKLELMEKQKTDM